MTTWNQHLPNTQVSPTDRTDGAGQLQRARRNWRLWFALLMLVSLITGVLLMRSGWAGPDPVLFVWFLYIGGAALILYRPRYGIYLILFFALAGDSLVLPWYPFTKNLSSAESLLYLGDAYIVSPAEIYMLLTFLGWFLQGRIRRRLRFRAGRLLFPTALFGVFVVLGLIYGIGFRGGDLRIGLWEARPMLYLPLMVLLASNLLREPAHLSNAVWAAILGIFVKSVAGSVYYFTVLEMDVSDVERITEHAAAIQMNTIFILAIAAWLFGASRAKRVILPLMVPLVLVPYLVTQRRAAFLTLAVALAFLPIVLYRVNRRAFWSIVPVAVVLALGYLGAFWNSSSAIGLPAQAVKSVIAQSSANAADVSSNLYRLIENVNLSYTIHQAPLRGVGFGNKFYTLVTLPDISRIFEWWQYFPHNSIIWIWVKMGIGGFISMLLMVGLALSVGAGAWWRVPRGDMRAIALMGTLYILMHFLFAYVDISWDVQSMIYVGTMMGILSVIELVGVPHVEARDWSYRTPKRLVRQMGVQ